MIKYKLFMIGFIILISCVLLMIIFRNPYPCSGLGIGCQNIWEYLSDTWAEFVGVIGGIIGILIMVSSVTLSKKKGDKEDK